MRAPGPAADELPAVCPATRAALSSRGSGGDSGFRGGPGIECDPEQLKQVLLNLIINAIQATEGHGAVTLSAAAQNGKVLMQVKDEGCGINPENLDKIFDPFFTTKEPAPAWDFPWCTRSWSSMADC